MLRGRDRPGAELLPLYRPYAEACILAAPPPQPSLRAAGSFVEQQFAAARAAQTVVLAFVHEDHLVLSPEQRLAVDTRKGTNAMPLAPPGSALLRHDRLPKYVKTDANH